MPRQPYDETSQMRTYMYAILEKQGRDFFTCELCGKKSHKKLDIHHTKYDGATIKDLKIACRSCNTIDENKGLI